jgi:hypothetical protein
MVVKAVKISYGVGETELLRDGVHLLKKSRRAIPYGIATHARTFLPLHRY